jgi:YgiT-type zinc finger domain-containing protein
MEPRFQDQNAMTCVICKQGETNPGLATVTWHRGESTIIFKQVAAEECGNCGEYYFSQDIAERVLSRAEEAVKKGAEIEILRFTAQGPLAEPGGGFIKLRR